MLGGKRRESRLPSGIGVTAQCFELSTHTASQSAVVHIHPDQISFIVSCSNIESRASSYRVAWIYLDSHSLA